MPPYIPPVYETFTRRVDVEGYVNLHTNRYSVPSDLIGRRVEVREMRNQVRVFDGHRLVVTHARMERGLGHRVTLPEHRGPSRWKRHPRPPLPQEAVLRAAAPEFARMLDELKKRHCGRAVRGMRQLHRIYLDYPLEAILPALETAMEYGLVDLVRIE
ncbi:MAG: IS21 family transposase, partial [Candidatus Eisenbacteria sp.]|nr:IS21 family transposase [Candidatus Eisenbacteria bacterium]